MLRSWRVRKQKDILLKLSFNSNGKVINKEVVVKLTTSSTAPFEFKEKEIMLNGKDQSVTLAINGLVNETIAWTSSHENIAEVSEQGIVTSKVFYGTVEICATSTMRPDKSDICFITVKRPSMVLKDPQIEMYDNESTSLISLTNGVESATEEIEWLSSDVNVATVDLAQYHGSPHPMIFAHSEGMAELTGTIKSKLQEKLCLFLNVRLS